MLKIESIKDKFYTGNFINIYKIFFIETRPCLTNPCMHGGRCIDSFSGFHWSFGPMQFYCVCKSPFKGLNCERKLNYFYHCDGV